MLIFDIGGTFIKYAVIEDEKILFKAKVPTPDGSLMTSVLIKVIEEIKLKYDFTEVGISTAGQVDAINGKIIFAGPTMPNYTGVELKQEIEAQTGYRTTILNDVESCIYNFEDVDNLLYISLGTGIGGAYKHHGKVFRGENGIALEVGHIYHPQGNSFEEICSTRSLLNNYYQVAGKRISGEEFDQLVLAKDKLGLEVAANFFADIAIGLVNLKYILDYNHVIVGGGITEAKFFTAERLTSALQEVKAQTDLTKLKVEVAALGNDAPLLGVYKYIKLNEEQNEI